MDTSSSFLRKRAKERPGADDIRSQVAAELRDARKEEGERNERSVEVREWLEHNVSEAARKKEGELRQLASQIETAREALEDLRGNMLQEVWNRKEIRRLRGEITRLLLQERHAEREVAFHEGAAEEAQGQLDDLAEAGEGKKPMDVLTAYYEDERRQWREQDVDREDLERYMSTDYLASLDMDSYVEVLGRFPSEMVTHVSRRGVRDHADLMYHKRGLGQVSNAFDRVLESGRLQSNISLKLEQDQRDQYVAKQIGLEEVATREEAYEAVEQLVAETGWSSFADHSAVHFATEVVADSYYGSERENEVFVAFPSALIASEYAFGGYQGQDLSTPHPDMQQNDLWVWEKDQEGLQVDAGVVFLPKETQVDPRTGSRYMIGGDGEAVPNTRRFETLKRAIEDGSMAEVAASFDAALDTARFAQNDFAAHKMKREAKDRAREALASIVELSDDELEVVSNNVLQLSRLTEFVDSLPDAPPAEQLDYRLRSQLQDLGLLFQEAQETVSAQDYWESYFTQHPGRRPSKIVYYSEESPTQALRAWKERHGLVKTHEDVSLDMNADREGYARDTVTQSKFRAIAREVIDRHFDALEGVRS